MEIIIEPHTLERANERGAAKTEIIEVLQSGLETKAKKNRFGKAKVFDYNSFWNDKHYQQKKVEVIYTIEGNNIITITVYVFYGKWE